MLTTSIVSTEAARELAAKAGERVSEVVVANAANVRTAVEVDYAQAVALVEKLRSDPTREQLAQAQAAAMQLLQSLRANKRQDNVVLARQALSSASQASANLAVRFVQSLILPNTAASTQQLTVRREQLKASNDETVALMLKSVRGIAYLAILTLIAMGIGSVATMASELFYFAASLGVKLIVVSGSAAGVYFGANHALLKYEERKLHEAAGQLKELAERASPVLKPTAVEVSTPDASSVTSAPAPTKDAKLSPGRSVLPAYGEVGAAEDDVKEDWELELERETPAPNTNEQANGADARAETAVVTPGGSAPKAAFTY